LNKGKDKNKIKDIVDYSIKWTRAVKNDLAKGKKYVFDENEIAESLYRPFVKKQLYFSKELNEMRYQLPLLFKTNNWVIALSGTSSSKPFSSLITNTPYCYDLLEKTNLYPLQIKKNKLQEGQISKPKLRADKDAGIIFLDENTELHGIPAEAWTYKLGNRSALEWILDQYQETKPKDPTIASTFNTYRFVDHKEQVIDLLKRVCSVSVETMKIIEEMESLN
ncbi:MAG: hypothetical protein LBP64_01680, partial [Tannerella sp.]|nr:hypothetical protein [Tannerella sp.]